jgi:DNA-binding transcriptional MerR regulator
MDLKEIKDYFAEHKDEFENYVGEILPDRVKPYLETEEGQKILRPYVDKNFDKGLKTWQENNLKKVIDDEIAKRYPPETEEKKALRELQQKFEQLDKEKRTEQQRNKAITYATQKGLPLDIIDHFVGDDDDKTTENLSKLEKSFTEHLRKTVDGVFKAGGSKPGGAEGSGTGKFTKESLSKMSADEINANWPAIEKQLSEGKI